MHSYREVVNECLKLREQGAEVATIGTSKHGNKILMVTLGRGAKHVLIVCRQHGNEPTSTEAMLEFMKELLAQPTKNNRLIQGKLKLHIIPIANPDGAIVFERLCKNQKTTLLTSYVARSNRPYRGDINRDHKKRKNSEAQAIFNLVKQIQPHLILDLHNFFSAYRYFILQRTFHDFCPAFSTHSKIKPKIRETCFKLCKVSIEAVKSAGGKPAEINGLWPGIQGRMLVVNEGVLETYYPLYFDIPSLTLEALGGFNLCSKGLSHGKKLHKAAVQAILEAFAKF